MGSANPGTNETNTVVGVVLAAGMSTRMGQFKPLMRLGGEMLVRRVVRGLVECGAVGEIIVVTGYRGREVAETVGGMDGTIRVVENARFADGEMISSVLVGMEAVRAGAAGVVLAFADQPAVRAETVRVLVEEFLKGKSPVVLPVNGGRRGHPIVISSRLIGEIRQLTAGDTLRTVVHRHLGETLLVQVEDPGVVEDLDTPEDYARAEARFRSDGSGDFMRSPNP